MPTHSWDDRKVKELLLYKACVDILNLWGKVMTDIANREAHYFGKYLNRSYLALLS